MFEFPRKHLLSYQVGISFLLSRGLTRAKAIWLSMFLGEYKLLPHVSPCLKKKQNLIGGFRYVLFHIYAYIYFKNVFISYIHTRIYTHCMCKCIYMCMYTYIYMNDYFRNRRSCGILKKNSDILNSLLMGNDAVSCLTSGIFNYEESILNF